MTEREDNMYGIETTQEYFKRIAEDEELINVATEKLNKLGVAVTTEYGNYRPLYDILRDLGEIWNSMNVNRDHIHLKL